MSNEEINRNQPFDRQTFIDEKKATEAAFSKGTWFVVNKNGELVEEPMPESVKATGEIPEGYALDHVLDPATVVSALTEANLTSMDQVPYETIAKVKGIINGADNVNIVPIHVVEGVSWKMFIFFCGQGGYLCCSQFSCCFSLDAKVMAGITVVSLCSLGLWLYPSECLR